MAFNDDFEKRRKQVLGGAVQQNAVSNSSSGTDNIQTFEQRRQQILKPVTPVVEQKKVVTPTVTATKTAVTPPAQNTGSIIDSVINAVKNTITKLIPQLSQQKPNLEPSVPLLDGIKTPTKPLTNLEGTTEKKPGASAQLTPQAQTSERTQAIGGFTKNIVDSVLRFTSEPVDPTVNTLLKAVPGVNVALNTAYKKGTEPLDVLKGVNEFITKKIEKVNPTLASVYTGGTFLVPGKFEYFIAKEIEKAPKELEAIWKNNRKTILEKLTQSSGVGFNIAMYFAAPKIAQKLIPKTTQKQILNILGMESFNVLKLATYKNLVPLVNVLSRGAARGATSMVLINAAQQMKKGLNEGQKPEEILKTIIETTPENAVYGGVFGTVAEGWGVAKPKLFGYRQAGVTEMTPEQARAQVEGTDLKGTPAGDRIMQEALKAEAAGGHVRIEVIGTTKGVVEQKIGAEKAKVVAGAAGAKVPEPIPASPDVVKTESVKTPGNVDIRVTTVKGPTEAQKLTEGTETKVEQTKNIRPENGEVILSKKTTLYRGTDNPNPKLEVSPDPSASYGKAIYMFERSEPATDFAPITGKVLQIKPIRELKLYTPTEEERTNITDLNGEEQQAYINTLLKDKYDGFRILKPKYYGTAGEPEIVIYNEDLVSMGEDTQEIKTVPLKDVDSGLSDYIKKNANIATPKIKAMEETLKNGGSLEPIPVYEENGKYILNKDGFHRLQALKNQGITDIQVRVETKTTLTASEKQRSENKIPENNEGIEKRNNTILDNLDKEALRLYGMKSASLGGSKTLDTNPIGVLSLTHENQSIRAISNQILKYSDKKGGINADFKPEELKRLKLYLDGKNNYYDAIVNKKSLEKYPEEIQLFQDTIDNILAIKVRSTPITKPASPPEQRTTTSLPSPVVAPPTSKAQKPGQGGSRGGVTPPISEKQKQINQDILTSQKHEFTYKVGTKGQLYFPNAKKTENIIVSGSYMENGKEKYNVYVAGKRSQKAYHFTVNKEDIKPIENKPAEKGQPVKETLVMQQTKATKSYELLAEIQKLGLPESILSIKKGDVAASSYKAPMIGKADLKLFAANNKEFKENPILVVDEQKNLTFTSPNFKFKIAPERMQLSRQALQVGDKIKVDIESLKGTEQQMRVYQSGNAYADAGGYADVESAEKTVSKIKAIEFPELLRIAKELLGTTPTLKAYRRALGMFYADPTNPNIKLNPLIFKDPVLAAKVFAHEIGHLTDFIPDKTMKRGNLLGRIASLQSYHKSFLEESPTADKGLLTEEDRKRLRKEAKELANKPIKVESEVIVGETTAKPEEILAIWNDTNAGTLYPELQRYIQTLSSAQKIEIVKHALKGTVPEWIGFKEYIKKTVVTEMIKNAPADIKAIYERLIKEELDRRNLFYVKEVRQELKAMTQIWKPFVEALVPASYKTYRYSGPELYADAISVLFNDPDLLKETAPEFYRGFFNYLDNKPEAKNIFEDIWTTLNSGEGAVFKKRDEAMSEAFATAEEKYAALHVETQVRKSNLVETIRTLIDDKNQAIINKTKEAIKNGADIPVDQNPIYEMAALNYMSGKVKNYIEDKFQPVYKTANEVPDGWNLLGKVLQLERTIYERGDLANPGGYDPLTAKAQLEGLESNTPTEDWKKIQEAKEGFRKAVQDGILQAEKAGYYTPDMIELMKANPAYAAYQVIDYLDTYVSAGVKQQVGTLKDVANPATSTVMKTISLIRAIERNNAKRSVVNMVLKGFPADITASKTRYNGKAQEIMDTREKDKGTIRVIVNGKVVGYDTDKSIADSLNGLSNEHIRAAANITRMFSLSPIYRPLFTALNLGFQTFNFVRDFERYWKNVPDYTLGQALTSFPRAVLRYGQAVPSAIARATGKSTKLIREMENAKMLGLKINDVFKEPVNMEDQEIKRVMQGIGVLNVERKRKAFLLPAIKVIDAIEILGNFIETLPKVAGYIELKDKMPKEKLAHFIRTSVGSPDFLTGGTLTPVTNSIFLFSNAAKEGVKTDVKVAAGRSEGGKESQAGFWWKTVIATILPKIIMAAIGAGILGNKLKEQMDNVSEYDKSQYHIIPMGLDKNGKTIYLRVPQDETSRVMGAIVWKSLQMAMNKKAGIEDVMQILNIGAGQLPNLAPSFTSLGAIMQYIAGQNPYDSFRGRSVIPDAEFQAGPKYSLPYLLDWLAQTNGMGMVVPSYQPDNPTALQKFLNLPLLSNVVGRWVKVSDYGKVEQNREITTEIKTQKAVTQIENKKTLQKYVDKYNEGNKSIINKLKLEKELVKEVVGEGPYTSAMKTQRTNLLKKFRISVMRGKVDADVNALITATSTDERVALLLEMDKTRKPEEITIILKDLNKQKIISTDAIKAYKRAQKIK